MYSRKYINLVEIGLVVLEIQKVEFGNFAVPVNSTLVCRTSFFVFLATDTLLCVLILAVRIDLILECHVFLKPIVKTKAY